MSQTAAAVGATAAQKTAAGQVAAAPPQPATFAPSREDILSTLSFFFGDPASPEKLRDYSEHQAATYHFPGALCSLEPAAPRAARFLNIFFPACRCVLRPEYDSDASNAGAPCVVQASPLLTARPFPQTIGSETRLTT